MTLFDLDRNELLSVLEDYSKGLECLESAVGHRVYAENRVNHPIAKSYSSLLVLVFKAMMVFGAPSALSLGFIVPCGIVYALTENEALGIIIGVVSAIIIEIFYILIIKKAMKYLDEKFDQIKNTQYGNQKNFDYLQYCIENEKYYQEKVDEIYFKYSIPKLMSTLEPTRWIYECLCKNNVSLNRAIKAYHAHKQREEADRESSIRISNELHRQNEQERIADEAARIAEASRKELELQRQILQQMNDRQFINSRR